MKREPTLADRLLAHDEHPLITASRWNEKTRDDLRVAKKFVLDAQAAEYVARMLLAYPRIVADAQDFAIPPFERFWVEMPFQPLHRVITGEPTDPTGDRAVGYLFTGPTVKVGTEGWSPQLRKFDVAFLPMEYQLHQPMSPEQELRLAQRLGTSRIGLDAWYWGSLFNRLLHDMHTAHEGANGEDEWRKAGLRALRDNHGVTLAPLKDPAYEDRMGKVTHGSAGDLRNIIALLLFLNRTADLQTVRDVGMGQAIINRQPRPLMPHRVITLKLDPLPRLRTLAAGSGIKRRLHEVRGHFCHDKVARESGCQHGELLPASWGEWWEEYDVLRWHCTHCGGKRWWRHEHRRGRQEVGVVKEQLYAVTK